MTSTHSRTEIQTQREQLRTLHARCEQVRHGSRAVVKRNRIVRDASRAAMARSRALRASSMPAAA
jgi:hypothetical protein